MDLAHAIVGTLAVVALVALVGSLTVDRVVSWLQQAVEWLEAKARQEGQSQDCKDSRPMP